MVCSCSCPGFTLALAFNSPVTHLRETSLAGTCLMALFLGREVPSWTMKRSLDSQRIFSSGTFYAFRTVHASFFTDFHAPGIPVLLRTPYGFFKCFDWLTDPKSSEGMLSSNTRTEIRLTPIKEFLQHNLFTEQHASPCRVIRHSRVVLYLFLSLCSVYIHVRLF